MGAMHAEPPPALLVEADLDAVHIHLGPSRRTVAYRGFIGSGLGVLASRGCSAWGGCRWR